MLCCSEPGNACFRNPSPLTCLEMDFGDPRSEFRQKVASEIRPSSFMLIQMLVNETCLQSSGQIKAMTYVLCKRWWWLYAHGFRYAILWLQGTHHRIKRLLALGGEFKSISIQPMCERETGSSHVSISVFVWETKSKHWQTHWTEYESASASIFGSFGST